MQPTVSPEHATHEVEIIIERVPRRSPHHTTGHALYVLGKVPDGYELLRERHHEHDEPIKDDATPYTVHEGERFIFAPKDITPGAA